MKKASIFTTCLLAITLLSCNGSSTSKTEEQAPITTGEETQLAEPIGTDFLKNYADFVAQEIIKLEATPTAETVTESNKASEAFISKFGDPNAIEMTADAQKKFNELRDKYTKALEKAISK